MAWRKAPPALVARFAQALPADPAVERRQMFGYPAAFLGGNLFAGLHQEDVILRLGASDRAALLAAGGRPFEPMAGRTMKDYVALPEAAIGDDDALGHWLARAVAHARTLPAKARKAARTTRAATATATTRRR